MDANINSFLNWSQSQLAEAGVLSPRLDSEIILAHTLNLSRTDLWTQGKRVLSESEVKNVKKFMERRLNREPISLIVGHQEFWSLDFIVDENVLTPRPETELLVETALNFILSPTAKILDLGTGSGALAVAMAKEISESKVSAIDIDPKALSIAKKNAERHGVANQIEFICADLRKCDWSGCFSMVLSNPPYIKSADIQKIMPEVRNYEPGKALDGGVTGLDFYQAIIPMAIDRLEENGFLILEIGHDQADEVTALLDNFSCYRNVEVIQDYSGYDRVVKAKKKNG
ncbi:MAG TPA: peptide chain release factor N(5)-glutamine methyltransferase [Nitrospinae bacterium]|jgi:release factor glutamine methyltransferase|nr:peptide chain release factor N(5)-glutamine methyltransferase [Nitrospinota bacterium]